LLLIFQWGGLCNCARGQSPPATGADEREHDEKRTAIYEKREEVRHSGVNFTNIQKAAFFVQNFTLCISNLD
jgi:hypothetical protein